MRQVGNQLLRMRQAAIAKLCTQVTVDDPLTDRGVAWENAIQEVLAAEQLRCIESGADIDLEALSRVMESVDLSVELAKAADPHGGVQIHPLRAIHERKGLSRKGAQDGE